jgi:hypothetical protein
MGMFIRKNADSALQAHLHDPFDFFVGESESIWWWAISRAYPPSRELRNGMISSVCLRSIMYSRKRWTCTNRDPTVVVEVVPDMMRLECPQPCTYEKGIFECERHFEELTKPPRGGVCTT